MQYDSAGMTMQPCDNRAGLLGQTTVESGQDVEKSGQSNSISGQDSFKSGQSEIISAQDSFKSGQSSIETGCDTTDELECLKELVDQLERERENLLLGNREIYQELNKIDASKTATVSTLQNIARENSFLRKELAVVQEKEDSSKKKRERDRGEMQGLVKKVALLKQALQQASSATTLNASLQQEVTRLTEENLVGVWMWVWVYARACMHVYVCVCVCVGGGNMHSSIQACAVQPPLA